MSFVSSYKNVSVGYVSSRDNVPENPQRIVDELYTLFFRDAEANNTKRTISVEAVESVKSTQDNLNTLAAVATFLAAVQAQIISYSFQTNDNALQVAINVFFFVGLLLDVIAGCGAFVTVGFVKRHYDLLLRRGSLVKSLNEELEEYEDMCEQLRYMDSIFLHGFRHTRSAWRKMVEKMQEFEGFMETVVGESGQKRWALLDFQNTTKELSRTRNASKASFAVAFSLPIVAAFGVTCLLVGLLCYAKEFLPVAVWVCCFTTVAALGALLSSIPLFMK